MLPAKFLNPFGLGEDQQCLDGTAVDHVPDFFAENRMIFGITLGFFGKCHVHFKGVQLPGKDLQLFPDLHFFGLGASPGCRDANGAAHPTATRGVSTNFL